MKLPVKDKEVWFLTGWLAGPGHHVDEPEETDIQDFYSLGFVSSRVSNFGMKLIHGQIVANEIETTKKVEVIADDGTTHHVWLADLSKNKKELVRWAKLRFKNFADEWKRQIKSIEEEAKQ